MPRPTYTPPPNDPPVLGTPNFATDAQGYLGWFPSFGQYTENYADWLQTDFYGELLNGTAAAPSLTFQGDTDLGIYRISANVMGFSAGGSERVRVTTGGMQVTGLINGTAVIVNSTDQTPGRLLTTDAGPVQAFKRSNILGTVSQTAGVPTGAVMEYGTTANGDFLRLADGTQFCWGAVNPTWNIATNQTFTFPAPFSLTPFGGVTGNRSGSATATSNRQTVRASGAGGPTSWFLTLTGAGTNGTGADFQLGFFFAGRWY